MDQATLNGVLLYHEQTKHHFHRYARSLGYMDWQNQPDPFRSYQGNEPLPLPLLDRDPPTGYGQMCRREGIAASPLSLSSIAAFLELSLGLSAWKVSGVTRWALRINPSSGNLHPSECHLVLPDTGSLPGGVYHYNPFSHSLEPRAGIPETLWKSVSRHFGAPGFLVGLTSIVWRESWKYGERGFRYCLHDAGHALACLSFSASLQGWRLTYLNALSDRDVKKVLGIYRTEWPDQEEEVPEFLCFVCPQEARDIPRNLPDGILSGFSRLSFGGRPNLLSREHVRWDLIDRAVSLTEKPETQPERYDFGSAPFLRPDVGSVPASRIIRQRRSAVALSPEGLLGKDSFLDMLDHTLPRNGLPPFDAEVADPKVHLLIFLHRVEGLEPGLHFFCRDEARRDEIRNSSEAGLLWKQVEKGFPLYLLKRGDFHHEAFLVSCEQELAGLGAFSLGMVARFAPTLEPSPYRYRHLFWECGMIGHVLYLAAEAHGVRGTGLGCFFDNPSLEVMGIQTNAYQSLYHFAVGRPVEDRRLSTLPPYEHLAGEDRRPP
ncbi:MAG: nitroreductase family protein [Thermodesulfobacteriota bacterium]